MTLCKPFGKLTTVVFDSVVFTVVNVEPHFPS